MFCKNCGKEILEQDRFCSYCGTKVEEEIVDLSDEAQEKPIWGIFARFGHVLSLITIIGGCLSFGIIGLVVGEFAIVCSALGLRSEKYYFKAKQALRVSIIGAAISTAMLILLYIIEIIAIIQLG